MLFRSETEFHHGSTKHFTYAIDRMRGRKPVRHENTWFRAGKIGEGGFSRVYLEKELKSGQLRAVKVVKKSLPVDYNRELLAMARLSKVIQLSTSLGP